MSRGHDKGGHARGPEVKTILYSEVGDLQLLVCTFCSSACQGSFPLSFPPPPQFSSSQLLSSFSNDFPILAF